MGRFEAGGPIKSATQPEPEPWMRGTLQGLPAVARAVLHAFEMAEEDIAHWCDDLSVEEVWSKPYELTAVGVHLRHIAGSVDRLLTYAEGKQLSPEQFISLEEEATAGADFRTLQAVLGQTIEVAQGRVLVLAALLEEPRTIGRRRLPTTVGGLLVHCAEHTQRHVGQTVTTAKLLKAMRQSP